MLILYWIVYILTSINSHSLILQFLFFFWKINFKFLSIVAIQQSRAIQQSNKRTRLLLILVYSMLYLPLKLRGICILVLFSFRPVFWLKVFYSILLNFFRMPSMGGERRLYFIIKTFCIVKLEPFFYTTVYDTSYTNPIKKNYMSSIYTTPMQISVGHLKYDHITIAPNK